MQILETPTKTKMGESGSVVTVVHRGKWPCQSTLCHWNSGSLLREAVFGALCDEGLSLKPSALTGKSPFPSDRMRRDELAAISGPNEFAEFYNRLKQIKEFHRKHPHEVDNLSQA